MPRFEGPYLMYVILNQIGIHKNQWVWQYDTRFNLEKNKNLETSDV